MQGWQNRQLAQSQHKTILFLCPSTRFFKLECLKIKHKTNHFALRVKFFIRATLHAYAELQNLRAA